MTPPPINVLSCVSGFNLSPRNLIETTEASYQIESFIQGHYMLTACIYRTPVVALILSYEVAFVYWETDLFYSPPRMSLN